MASVSFDSGQLPSLIRVVFARRSWNYPAQHPDFGSLLINNVGGSAGMGVHCAACALEYYKKPEHALNACLVLIRCILVANARSGGGFPSARIIVMEPVPLRKCRVKCCATADGPGAPMS